MGIQPEAKRRRGGWIERKKEMKKQRKEKRGKRPNSITDSKLGRSKVAGLNYRNKLVRATFDSISFILFIISYLEGGEGRGEERGGASHPPET